MSEDLEKRIMNRQEFKEAFALVARKYLKVTPGAYNWLEYESGLDHEDVESLSEFAMFFFKHGYEIGRHEMNKNPKTYRELNDLEGGISEW